MYENVEAYISACMSTFDDNEQTVAKNLEEVGVGWEILFSTPMTDSARFMSAQGH